ncbi:CHAT domain-containing protein [Streptomyces sp. WAC06614]|uniref:CHAT domain-containing protein n=1 Tax=Streptomyces sp. WAC06614 TaxID=2487416 RepID=UPI00163D0BC2|nr:CHAT domain-containing protein [Streptomyces sp. WAC06614]
MDCSVEVPEVEMDGLPFRLEVFEAGSTWVVTCASECGEAEARVPAPFSEDELRIALAQIETALTKSFSALVTRRASVSERPVRDFGERLAGAVLNPDIFIQFDRCRSRARSEKRPLRVLVRTSGPNVERIPWEYLVDPSRQDYLALKVPIVRRLRLMNPAPPLSLTLPLRVLGITARPTDLPALDVERERDSISGILRTKSSENVDVQWLRSDRWHDLADELRFGSWHVLHCVCHGGFDAERGAGYIELTADDGTARPVYAEDIGSVLEDGAPLRLIVLNACDSAVCGADDVFSSTAAALARVGVPAVVAMQHEITDGAAFTFASSFYERIAEGLPVDRAVTLAREDMKIRLGSLEWATPVLFLASDETRIFSVPESRQEPHEPPIGLEKEEERPRRDQARLQPRDTATTATTATTTTTSDEPPPAHRTPPEARPPGRTASRTAGRPVGRGKGCGGFGCWTRSVPARIWRWGPGTWWPWRAGTTPSGCSTRTPAGCGPGAGSPRATGPCGWPGAPGPGTWPAATRAGTSWSGTCGPRCPPM